MLHKCTQCSYITDIKCNLKRHCIRKHESSENDKKSPDSTNIKEKCENPNITCENLLSPFQCEKCTKVLSNKRNLKYHMNVCKGVKNSLECHICHRLFNSHSAKSFHLKTCSTRSIVNLTLPSQTLPPSPTTAPQTINNTYISGNQNNTINNTINNNITILAVDPTKLENLDFVTDHITNPDLKKILKITHKDMDDSKKITMLETYMRHLMANPVNKCIKKTNMQNVYSQVHVGDNKWETKHDKDLYPKLTCNVAQGFSGLMVLRNSDAPMIKTERKLEELKAFLDYMADEGYRNDSNPDVNHQTHLDFKELVQRIKAVIFDVFKIAM